MEDEKKYAENREIYLDKSRKFNQFITNSASSKSSPRKTLMLFQKSQLSTKMASVKQRLINKRKKKINALKLQNISQDQVVQMRIKAREEAKEKGRKLSKAINIHNDSKGRNMPISLVPVDFQKTLERMKFYENDKLERLRNLKDYHERNIKGQLQDIPTLNEKSIALGNIISQGIPIHKRVNYLLEKKEKKLKEIKEEHQKARYFKEYIECTFHPEIKKSSSARPNKQSRNDFLNRQSDFVRKKRLNQKKSRYVQLKKEAKELTFKPEISKKNHIITCNNDETPITEALYLDAFYRKEKQKKESDLFFNQICPFEPKINKKSKRKAKQNIQGLVKSRSKSSKFGNNITKGHETPNTRILKSRKNNPFEKSTEKKARIGQKRFGLSNDNSLVNFSPEKISNEDQIIELKYDSKTMKFLLDCVN